MALPLSLAIAPGVVKKIAKLELRSAATQQKEGHK
jgi:hypothetical protein